MLSEFVELNTSESFAFTAGKRLSGIMNVSRTFTGVVTFLILEGRSICPLWSVVRGNCFGLM